MEKQRVLSVLLYVFTFEKAIQHLFTGLFFVFNIPGIGTPDIGANLQISNEVMALLNFIYFGFFALGIGGFAKGKNGAIRLIVILALLDVVLEFVFHHFFFITVSVISSLILTAVSISYMRTCKKNTCKGH